MSARGRLVSLELPGRVLRLGWKPPKNLSYNEWKAAGDVLGKVGRSVTWCIGDWWLFGQRYGDRVDIVKSEGWDGPDHQTCRNAGSVAAAFDVSRRRDRLSFTHHAEVASFSPQDADALLDWAELGNGKQPRSTRELRAEANKRRGLVSPPPSSETCTLADLDSLVATGARFGCIYADPPYLYMIKNARGAAANHYDGLTIDELCAMPIDKLAAADAHLHLWVTNQFLFEAPRIFAAWGFGFRSSFVWVKPNIGLGHYWRNAHDILLTGARGDATRFNDQTMRSWIETDRGAHSAKPEEVRGMLERASPGPYLELFGRRLADNWTVFGDQIERNLFLPMAAE